MLRAGERMRRQSGVKEIKPRSKARSWRTFKQRPLRGSARRCWSFAQGMMWEAFRRAGMEEPVMAQRFSYAARTDWRKKVWTRRTRMS